jgi:MFS family permease
LNREVAFKEKLVNYNIKINVISGIFSVIAVNLVTPYFAKFAERLGAGDYEIGLLSSLPSAVGFFTLIPGAILIESFNNKKNITGTIIFTHKVFFLLLATVPFAPKNYQALLFVFLVGLMNLPGSIAGIGYQSCIGDIFDSENLGKAMSSRNIYSTAVGILITLLSAQLITKIPNTNKQTIILYQVLFIINFIIAQGEIITFLKFRGMRTVKKEKEKRYIDSLKETIKNIPRERNYVIFMISSLVFYFGWQMGWPLFNIYTISNLKADEFWLSIIAVSSSIASIAAYKPWAKFARKKGNIYALFIATIGMSITPLLYAVSKNLIVLVVFNIIIGVSTAGTVQILFNLLLEVTPNTNRTVYIAIYNTLMNLSAAISPLIGVAIKDKTNIFTTLIIVSFLRFLGSIAFMISSKLIGKGQIKTQNNQLYL